jgi:hypothetical protein
MTPTIVCVTNLRPTIVCVITNLTPSTVRVTNLTPGSDTPYSLARNTAGFTRWARVAVDANDESKEIAKRFNVTQVPAFVFLAQGKVVDTYQVGLCTLNQVDP